LGITRSDLVSLSAKVSGFAWVVVVLVCAGCDPLCGVMRRAVLEQPLPKAEVISVLESAPGITPHDHPDGVACDPPLVFLQTYKDDTNKHVLVLSHLWFGWSASKETIEEVRRDIDTVYNALRAALPNLPPPSTLEETVW
jgi:hypothetical protein